MSRYPKGPTQRDRMVELAERPEGATSNDMQTILGMPAANVCVNLQAIEYQGRVLRAKAEGHRLRWFASAVDRAAWLVKAQAERAAVVAAQAEAQRKRNREREATRPKRNRVVARPAAPMLQKKAGPVALITYTAGSSKVAPKLDNGPIDYSRAKYTIDDKQRPVARWQMQPSAPAEFSPLGIGRYLA